MIKKSLTRRVGLAAIVGIVASSLGYTPINTSTSVQAAASDVIVSTFYVPLFEDNAWSALTGVQSSISGDPRLSSTVSITVSQTGTIIFYDQWEDGYEASPNVPVSASTLVFGDGNVANGNAAQYCIPARCNGDLMPSGAVLRLNNSATVDPGPLSIPRSSGTIRFDGRDKISATGGLAVTHATWPTAVNALHSEMASAFGTSRWGSQFVSPVGTNSPIITPDGSNPFSYVGMEVMAKEAGTVVSIDANADGDYLDTALGDRVVTIGEGQTTYVNGTIRQGARVVASKPVQVFLMTGKVGSTYEDRSYQIFPTEGLVNDYWAPASTGLAPVSPATTTNYATVLYLYNPQPTPITITLARTGVADVVYTVPGGQIAGQTGAIPVPYLAPGQAARATSSSTFAAVAANGARQPAAAALGQDSGSTWDWGYSLIPSRLLSTTLDVGWAPGSQNLSTANYDIVYLTTNGATTVYVDHDGDPTTGPSVDANGAHYDVSYVVGSALQSTKITDPSDNDMTGTHIYTTNGALIAAVYGEDPAAAPAAFPGVDLGTAIFPSCGALCVTKNGHLTNDVDNDGNYDPGDTVLWTIRAINTGYVALTNAVVKDTLPAGVTYVAGSSKLGGIPLADDGTGTPYPFDGTGRNVGTIPVDGTLTITFSTTINQPYDGVGIRLVNTAYVISDQAAGRGTAEVPVDLTPLNITKTSSVFPNDAGGLGSPLSYTIVVTNYGSETLKDVAITDPLPTGLTWNSTSVTRPADITRADNFETEDYAGSTGTNAWVGGWTETGDGTDTPPEDKGEIRSKDDQNDRAIEFNKPANNSTLDRVVGNLTGYTGATVSFEMRRDKLEAGDSFTVQARANGSAAWVDLGVYDSANETEDAVYVKYTLPIADAQLGTATAIRFRVGGSWTDGDDKLYLDNVEVAVRPTSTVPGSAAPNLWLQPKLLPGETVTVVVNTTVSSTTPPQFFNIATARSGTLVARATALDCATCFDYGDAPATYESATPGGAADAGGHRVIGAASYTTTTFASDNFESQGFSGTGGSPGFAGSSWTVSGDGEAKIEKVKDNSNNDTYVIQFKAKNKTATVSRLVGNTSTCLGGASLSYDYKRDDKVSPTDPLLVQSRGNSSAAWVTLATITGTLAADALFLPAVHALQIGTATEVRFVAAFDNQDDPKVWIDNVKIECTAATYAATGPYFGTVIDRESGPASSANATGDNNNMGTNDEDGITVPSVDTNKYTFTFTVADPTPSTNYVNSWFDWNKNGVFDAAESLFSAGSFVSATTVSGGGTLNVVGGIAAISQPGTYSVTVNVPNLETNGSGYAIGDAVLSRFRVATASAGVAAATGKAADGEVQDYTSTLNTLPVNLSYFASKKQGGNVVVDWRTAQEVDNLGFNLYSEEKDGSLTLLTSEIVISKAPTSVVPQTYRLLVSGKAKILWLEDIALDGATELHGPYKVGKKFGDPNPPADIDWEAAQSEVDEVADQQAQSEVDAASDASDVRSAGDVTGPLARFEVSETGIQQVTFEQLLDVGVDLDGVPAASLAITDPNGPVAVEVVGGDTFRPGSALRFLGEALDTLYTGTNVYRLQVDPSLARPMHVDTTPPPGTPAAATTTTTTTTTTIPDAPRTTLSEKDQKQADKEAEKAAKEAAKEAEKAAKEAEKAAEKAAKEAEKAAKEAEKEAKKNPTTTTSTSTTSTTTTTLAPTTTTTTTTVAPTTTTTTPPPPPPAPVVPVTAYTETAELEINSRYSVTAPGSDPWYQQIMVSQPNRPLAVTSVINVADPLTDQTATAAVDLWGITRYDVDDEHHVTLKVNGVTIADAHFDDTNAYRLAGTIPSGVLVAGANTLVVTSIGDTGVPVDIIAVDRWEVTYQRPTLAIGNRIDLTAGGPRIDVTGLSAGPVLAYRVDSDGSVSKLSPWIDGTTVSIAATNHAEQAPDRYLVIADSAVYSPVVAPARPVSDLIDGSADYLIVTNAVFTDTLTPLVAYHESLGRVVKTVDVADVYAAYAGGVTDAHAIDRYLADAIPALGVRWLLMVGADSVDYRDYDGDGSFSLMPSLYGATGFGITYAPIDPAYADVDGDGVPDVALGRFPARTPGELTTMIDKTLTYASTGGDRSVVLVSDADDGVDYAAENDLIAAKFDGWTVRRSDVDRQGLVAARAELLDAINDGVGVTMYLGHSSSGEWTEVGLFDATAAAALTNAEHPTVVAQFGCWNTYYVSQGADTMAHALMLDANGGAASLMGATTLTAAANDALLANLLAEQLAPGDLTIGEALLAAKKNLERATAGYTLDVQLGWTMLGDPAMSAGTQ